MPDLSRPGSAARSWICLLLVGRWRLCQLILVCRTRRSTTGDAKTPLAGAWSRVLCLRRRRN